MGDISTCDTCGAEMFWADGLPWEVVYLDGEVRTQRHRCEDD